MFIESKKYDLSHLIKKIENCFLSNNYYFHPNTHKLMMRIHKYREITYYELSVMNKLGRKDIIFHIVRKTYNQIAFFDLGSYKINLQLRHVQQIIELLIKNRFITTIGYEPDYGTCLPAEGKWYTLKDSSVINPIMAKFHV